MCWLGFADGDWLEAAGQPQSVKARSWLLEASRCDMHALTPQELGLPLVIRRSAQGSLVQGSGERAEEVGGMAVIEKSAAKDLIPTKVSGQLAQH